MAVAGGHVGVGRFAIDLARAAGAEDRLLGPDERLAVLGVPDQRPAAAPFVREQVEREGVLPDLDVRQRAGAIDHGPHHFLAGGVAQGVDDAVVAVPAFAAQRQRADSLRRSCVPQSISSLMRAGASRTTISTTARSHSSPPADQRVGDVVLEAVLGIDARRRCRPWA